LKVNGHVRNSFVGTLDSNDIGQRSHMAAQSQLGILSKRRVWIDFVDPTHFGFSRTSPNWSVTVSNLLIREMSALAMNRFFAFVVLLVVVFACVGFFRGWFSMTTKNEPFTEKLDVNFQVDRDKMKQDANTVQDKTKSLFSSENGDRKLPQ